MDESQADPAWLDGLCERVARRIGLIGGVKAIVLGDPEPGIRPARTPTPIWTLL